jgi:T-complex protein 1 subunit eta
VPRGAKSEKENAELRITDPQEYQSIVDAEWRIIYEKLEAWVDCGANVVLSTLPIGDLATQYAYFDRFLGLPFSVDDGEGFASNWCASAVVVG